MAAPRLSWGARRQRRSEPGCSFLLAVGRKHSLWGTAVHPGQDGAGSKLLRQSAALQVAFPLAPVACVRMWSCRAGLTCSSTCGGLDVTAPGERRRPSMEALSCEQWVNEIMSTDKRCAPQVWMRATRILVGSRWGSGRAQRLGFPHCRGVKGPSDKKAARQGQARGCLSTCSKPAGARACMQVAGRKIVATARWWRGPLASHGRRLRAHTCSCGTGAGTTPSPPACRPRGTEANAVQAQKEHNNEMSGRA